MTLEEFQKIKEGDKVLLCDEPNVHWSWGMCEFAGKTVTVDHVVAKDDVIQKGIFTVKEDRPDMFSTWATSNKHAAKYWFTNDDIVELIPPEVKPSLWTKITNIFKRGKKD